MQPNPILGVIYHWIGGLASGSFYVPYKGVKKWAWEVYWLVGGFFSWIICPVFFASLMTEDLFGVIGQQSISTLAYTYFFGAMWGIGGLTFGLTMRYLGMSLGMGIALGYCTVFGTLLPPLLKCFVDLGETVPQSLVEIVQSTGGQVTMVGIGVTILGIFIAALAGLAKEREMPEAEKKKAIAEFNFKKGILIATLSGIMSAGMAFAITAAGPIGTASLEAGTGVIWTGLPKLVVVLLGGFTTNFIWCSYLNIKNRSGYQYFSGHLRSGHANLAPQPTTDTRQEALTDPAPKVPLLRNYFFSSIAGATWYFQFFFYTMGETQMGSLHFASWTLHMASIIIFSTLWGVYFKEWSGVSKKAKRLIFLGIATLVLSTIIIGSGSYLDSPPTASAH